VCKGFGVKGQESASPGEAARSCGQLSDGRVPGLLSAVGPIPPVLGAALGGFVCTREEGFMHAPPCC